MFSKLFGSKKKAPSIDVSGLTEAQKSALFEQYCFDKFDKKYFKLLKRKKDTVNESFIPDLEYEFRHNAFVRKFSAVVKYIASAADGVILVDELLLNELRTYSANSNIESYIVLGIGEDPTHPDHVFTIPLIHFKTNPVSLNSLDVFKKEPEDDFFYQRDIDCLT